jgi:hypothetical protein
LKAFYFFCGNFSSLYKRVFYIVPHIDPLVNKFRYDLEWINHT